MKSQIMLKNALALPLLGAAWLITIQSHAAESHPKAQAWTPASLTKALAAMPYGNATRGEKLNNELMCASCHGEKGIAPTPNWPGLAGQKADYTYKILLDYQTGLRNEDDRSKLMQTLAQMMNRQQMADVAAYYASLPAPRQTDGKRAESSLADAEKLVRKGDRSRLMTPCASCHGLHAQGGKAAAPALNSLSRESFIRTLSMYKSGKRHNDVNQSMSQFARKLSDKEIEQLADYYELSGE